MELTDIEKLAKLMKNMGLSSLEWTEQDRSVKLTMDTFSGESRPWPTGHPAGAAPETAAEIVPSAPAPQGTVFKAPMVGMLYLTPAPDAKPFVAVGDKVKKGDVLCIIEAMKLMNEIAAEQDGEIVEILAESEQIVEFGQPLFIIR